MLAVCYLFLYLLCFTVVCFCFCSVIQRSSGVYYFHVPTAIRCCVAHAKIQLCILLYPLCIYNTHTINILLVDAWSSKVEKFFSTLLIFLLFFLILFLLLVKVYTRRFYIFEFCTTTSEGVIYSVSLWRGLVHFFVTFSFSYFNSYQ